MSAPELTTTVVRSYDGKRFRPVGTEPAGIAAYRQQDTLLTGTMSPCGDLLGGSLAGFADSEGVLDFAYTMALKGGVVVAGLCRSTPAVDVDDQLHLIEHWTRLHPIQEEGVSWLVEVSAE